MTTPLMVTLSGGVFSEPELVFCVALFFRGDLSFTFLPVIATRFVFLDATFLVARRFVEVEVLPGILFFGEFFAGGVLKTRVI